MTSTTYQLGRQQLGRWLLSGTIDHVTRVSLSEQLTLTDSVIPGQDVKTSVTESLVLQDSIASSNVKLSQSLSESLLPVYKDLLGEAVLSYWILGRASRSDYRLDYVSWSKLITRSVAESLTLSDSYIAQRGYAKFVQDSITLSDALSIRTLSARNLQEYLIPLPVSPVVATFPFSINGYGIPIINLANFVVQIDSVSRFKFTVRDVLENLGLSDSVLQYKVKTRSVADSLPLNELVTRSVVLQFLTSIVANIDYINRNLSLNIRETATQLGVDKFASSSDYNRPNNGQPTPGTGSEIFDDVPETINEGTDGTPEDTADAYIQVPEVINESTNFLGTDVVPLHE